MDKIKFMRLWDIYHAVLTPTQQEITDLYFNLDLSISEIAETKGVSRQAVSDCLLKCKQELLFWEQKLHFVQMLLEGDMDTSCRLTDLTRWSQRLLQAHPDLQDEVAECQAIINKDYSAEVARMLPHIQDDKA